MVIGVNVAAHEGSHLVVARLLGYEGSMNFRFKLGWLFNVIPVPRIVWDMPAGTLRGHAVLIGVSGFVGEFFIAWTIFATLHWFIPLTVFIIHIFLYKLYCGEYNDWQWI
jgi:hypothetical protein